MEHTLLDRCPVCTGDLVVTGLRCRECGISVQGSFWPGEFSRLDANQSAFLRQFVLCRGNLRELSRRLGVSYPTARGRLDDLVAALEDQREATGK